VIIPFDFVLIAAVEENPKKFLGRPWKTHEGFQHILRGQVDALIKLGVDAKLEVCDVSD